MNTISEDKFYKKLEYFFPSWDNDNLFLDEFPEICSFDNVETEEKIETNGSWIMREIENGLSVHFAKKVKIDDYFLDRLIKKNNNKISKVKDKTIENKLLAENAFYLTCQQLSIKPYFVKIQKTATTFEYILPYQYKLCKDVDIYVDLVLNKNKHIKTKNLFKNLDENVIFYLQSRGISKERAIIMSKLKNISFYVNITNMIKEHETF
jgi:hypothetical protein